MSRPLVKVCGVRNAANALACVQAGAGYLGLNFHPPSPRSISVEEAVPLAAALRRRAHLVGLFVDLPIDQIAVTLHAIPEIDSIQLHGSESVGYLEACRALPSHPSLIRAFRLRDGDDVAAMTAYLDEAATAGASPDAILIDALVDGQQGGTGHSIPVDLLAQLPGHPRLILAGGLTPENVAVRVRLARPWMVDVASGVESVPGHKDPTRVAAFVRAAQS